MKNRKLVKEIAGAVVDDLKKSKKEELLGEVIAYLKRKDVRSIATVVSPRKLNLKEKNDVKRLVEKLTGEVPNKINFLQDEKLIDGLKVSFRDKLWDFSLRKQISSLTKL